LDAAFDVGGRVELRYYGHDVDGLDRLPDRHEIMVAFSDVWFHPAGVYWQMGAQVERDHRRRMDGDAIRQRQGRAGQVARSAYAILAVVTCVSFIGYAFQGIGKFAQVYIPAKNLASYLPFAAEYLIEYKAHTLALLIFGLTTVYIVFGGLYGVVLTDMIQTVILTVAAILVGVIAYRNVTPAMLAANLPDRFASVEEFASLRPVWRLKQFAGTESAIYHMFGAMAIAWVIKGLLLSAGGPAQLYDLQRYLAAKNPRDAAKIALLWPFFQSVRWLMVMAITLLALTGFAGVTDAELVMPAVLQEYLPTGLRGLVIAGLQDCWLPLCRRSVPPSTAGRPTLSVISGNHCSDCAKMIAN
jgi:Na+/proline symporter